MPNDDVKKEWKGEKRDGVGREMTKSKWWRNQDDKSTQTGDVLAKSTSLKMRLEFVRVFHSFLPVEIQTSFYFPLTFLILNFVNFVLGFILCSLYCNFAFLFGNCILYIVSSFLSAGLLVNQLC